MRKKNKRKEPEFKKPFIVLTRRKIAGWVFVVFFLCAWMFVLGILVGRGTAPVKFDIAAIEKKIEASKRNDPGKPGKMPAHKDSATLKDKTKLEFYEALRKTRKIQKFRRCSSPRLSNKRSKNRPLKPLPLNLQRRLPQSQHQGKLFPKKQGRKKPQPVKNRSKGCARKAKSCCR